MARKASYDERTGTVASLFARRRAASSTSTGDGVSKLRAATRPRSDRPIELNADLVAMMSHEIRTPMNAVLGMTDLLRLTNMTRKQEEYVQVIEGSGNMLLTLINNILDYSVLGAGRLKLQKSEFSLAELLTAAFNITGYQACSKNIELAARFETDMSLRVSGDMGRICQVLVNLISNAVKFSERGEIIVSIGAEVGDEHTMLGFCVLDQGIGMTDAVKAQLFRPFVRADDHVTRRQQGSGLGLAISKRLIEYMNGDIQVHSGPGTGTEVCFTVQVDSVDTARRFAPLADPVLLGKRALIVHPNADIARVICSYAVAWGLDCEESDSFDAALIHIEGAQATHRGFDFVISDNGWEAGAGLEFARRIRATPPIADVPVVLMTPISRPLERGEISAIGRVACVNKPVDPDSLHRALLDISSLEATARRRRDFVAHCAAENEPLKILIAEDHQLSRELLRSMLSSLGYEPDTVADGPAVLQAFARESYDLLLLDGQMPGMDGTEVTRRLRDSTDIRQPLIVAVTADASIAHRSACLDAGMDDFMSKPLRLEKIAEGLRRWRALLDNSLQDPNVRGSAAEVMVDQTARNRLRDRAGDGGGAFINQFIDLFLSDTATRLEALARAAERGDLALVSREAHSLKGVCLEFGAVRMAGYCDDMRQFVNDRQSTNITETLQRMRREFARMRPLFEAEKKARVSSTSRA